MNMLKNIVFLFIVCGASGCCLRDLYVARNLSMEAPDMICPLITDLEEAIAAGNEPQAEAFLGSYNDFCESVVSGTEFSDRQLKGMNRKLKATKAALPLWAEKVAAAEAAVTVVDAPSADLKAKRGDARLDAADADAVIEGCRVREILAAKNVIEELVNDFSSAICPHLASLQEAIAEGPQPEAEALLAAFDEALDYVEAGIPIPARIKAKWNQIQANTEAALPWWADELAAALEDEADNEQLADDFSSAICPHLASLQEAISEGPQPEAEAFLAAFDEALDYVEEGIPIPPGKREEWSQIQALTEAALPEWADELADALEGEAEDGDDDEVSDDGDEDELAEELADDDADELEEEEVADDDANEEEVPEPENNGKGVSPRFVNAA